MPDSQPVDAATGAVPNMPVAAPVVDDWPAQATDTIVRVVGQVRDKTTGPIQKAARATVYGLLAALLGIACVVLFAITLTRILDSYVVGEDNTWLAHFIVAFVFIVPGLILWRKGRQPVER